MTSGTPTPSHLLKLLRAGHHLADLDALLEGVRERREHDVIETVERRKKRQTYIYKLQMGEIDVPEEWPIIFGDFLFNVRSALDHLMVSIAPNKRKASTEFRICTEDPLAKDDEGNYVNEAEALRWQSVVKGFPEGFEEAFRSIQPFAQSEKHGYPAEDHALAILSALQNADKHRWLLTVFTGLEKAEITIDGDTYCSVPVLKDGIELFSWHEPAKVTAVGSAVVGVSSRDGEVREFGLLVEQLIKSVRIEVLPALETFITEREARD
jgi:hypothetical protein